MNYDISLGRSVWPSVEVTGEFAREAGIIAAIGSRPRPGRDIELDDVQVTLVPEPRNRHDKNAIAVHAGVHKVGYLSREDAVRYQHPIHRITASGAVAATTARIWASVDEWSGRAKFRARITVALPDPDMLLPINSPPEGPYNLLPWGSGLQVTKEEDHFDVLFHHVPPSGQGLMFVTLHKGVRTLKNGTEKPFMEVRADGERVGEMSAATSAHYLPIVENVESVGEIPTALAKIAGSALAAQLVLQAAKAPEISDEWLSSSPNQVPALLPWAKSYKLQQSEPDPAGAHAAPAEASQPDFRPPGDTAFLSLSPTEVPATLPQPSPVRHSVSQGPTSRVQVPRRSVAGPVLYVLGAAVGLFGAAFLTVGIESFATGKAGAGIVSLLFGAALAWATFALARAAWRRRRVRHVAAPSGHGQNARDREGGEQSQEDPHG